MSASSPHRSAPGRWSSSPPGGTAAETIDALSCGASVGTATWMKVMVRSCCRSAKLCL